MPKSKRIVISIPPRELGAGHAPGSVFENQYLDAFDISAGLKSAIEMVRLQYPDQTFFYIARPEIFTHGVLVEGLLKKIGPVREHIAMSDGVSAKLIPNLSNHLFVYGLHRHEGSTGFRKLANYVPEMFQQYVTQINSFQRFILNGAAFMPTARIIMPGLQPSRHAAEFYSFYMNEQSLEQNADKLLDIGSIEAPSLTNFKNITYVPFTESAAHDRDFCKMVAQAIELAYFDHTACILLRLPYLDADASLARRVFSFLGGIGDSRIKFPQIFCKNVLLVTEDLPESFFSVKESKVNMILHETFDFWRYTKDFYSMADHILFCLSEECQNFDIDLEGVLSDAFGKIPEIRRGRAPASE